MVGNKNNLKSVDAAEVLSDIEKVYFTARPSINAAVDSSLVTDDVIDSVVVSSYHKLFDSAIYKPETFDVTSKLIKNGLANFSNDYIDGELALNLDLYISALSDLNKFSTGWGEVDKLSSLDTLVALKNFSSVDFNDVQIQGVLINKRANSFMKEYNEEISSPEANSIEGVSSVVKNVVFDLNETYGLVDMKIPLVKSLPLVSSIQKIISIAKRNSDDYSSLKNSFEDLTGVSYDDFTNAKNNQGDSNYNPSFAVSRKVNLSEKGLDPTEAIISVVYNPKSLSVEFSVKHVASRIENLVIDSFGSDNYISNQKGEVLASNVNSSFATNVNLNNDVSGWAQYFANIYDGSQSPLQPVTLNQSVIAKAQEEAKSVKVQSGNTVFNYSITN